MPRAFPQAVLLYLQSEILILLQLIFLLRLDRDKASSPYDATMPGLLHGKRIQKFLSLLALSRQEHMKKNPSNPGSIQAGRFSGISSSIPDAPVQKRALPPC